MDLQVYINSIDKTDLIDWPSFSIEDNVDEQPNTCSFVVKKYTGQTYSPNVNDEIEVFDGVDKIFAGRILSIGNSIEGDVVSYEVGCKDYTSELDRILVTDSFTSTTVGEVIEYIIDNYTSGITYDNVDCSIAVSKIVFNKMTISKCISELARLVNYNWYIDYDKDIHFFVKNTEIAPFLISDNSKDIIGDSLKLENDLSQLRNSVTIRGGDKVATNTRTKTHIADGIQKTFNTDYKFASRPIVRVDSVAVTVGTENLDQSGFDCYWDYNQKYIRFDVAPTSTHEIEIEGYPLIPIIVQVEDLASISTYGRFEFAKTDKTIKSSEEAKLYGEAQLEAYGRSIREGGFRTYTSGLKSGQTLTINITGLVSDSFVIQRVTLLMITRTKGEWSVELATLKTMGIIQFLQDKLLNDNKRVDFNEDDVLEKYYQESAEIGVTEQIGPMEAIGNDHKTIEIEEDIAKDPFDPSELEFVLCPYTPTGNDDKKREFLLDRGLLA